MTYFPLTNDDLKRLCKNPEVKLEDIDTSNVKDMSEVFKDSDIEDFSGIEHWDVSNVEDMSYMFQNCLIKKLDLSNWCTKNLKKICGMFMGAALFAVNLSGLDTSHAEDFSHCFENTYFEDDPEISKWDLSSAKQIDNMFKNISNNSEFMFFYPSDIRFDDTNSYSTERMILSNFPSIKDYNHYHAISDSKEGLWEVTSNITECMADLLNQKGLLFRSPYDDTNIPYEFSEGSTGIVHCIRGKDFEKIFESLEPAFISGDISSVVDKSINAFYDFLEKYNIKKDVFTKEDIAWLKDDIEGTCEIFGYKKDKYREEDRKTILKMIEQENKTALAKGRTY